MAKNTDHAQDEIVIKALSRALDRALDRFEEYELRIAQLSVKISTLEDELSDLEYEKSKERKILRNIKTYHIYKE